jgi:hypothetical protein
VKRDGVTAISFHCCYNFPVIAKESIMKQLFILFLIISLSGVALANQTATMQKSPATLPTASTPETVVKDFYRWYIGRLNLNKNPLTKEKTGLAKYITPEFLRKAPKLLEQTNADVFICAQDWDKDWGKNARTSNLKIQGAVATVNVTLSGSSMNHKLKIRLKQVSSDWKIDKIDPLD